MAVRAEILLASGHEGQLFPRLDELPDHIVEQVALCTMNRLDRSDPRTHRTLLRELINTLEGRLGPDHQTTLNALSMLANIGRDAGDHAERIEAIQRVLASYDRQGRTEEAIMAALGLAMAQNDVGQVEEATRTYASARSRAEGAGRPDWESQVLRNWGIALSEAGQPGPAEQRLGEAVAQARRAADRETLGRAQIALGIFLQHQGRLAEARQSLEEGLSNLDPVHPDSIVGRSHLSAVMDGHTCGCGAVEETLADAFRQFVTSRLPADLLDQLNVTIEGGDFQIQVELRREPTEDELARLNSVIQSALAEFRRRIEEPRYVG